METPVKLPLGGYIQGTAPMHVPRFQRPYAWSTDEVADFIQDLSRTVERRQGIDGGDREGELHFFGGILSTQFAQPDTTPTYVNEVIDGQQRLATVFLTLIAIRKGLLETLAGLEAQHLTESGAATLARGLAETIWKSYLTYSHQDLRTGKTEQRQALILSDLDRDFFKTIVSGVYPKTAVGSPPSHKRLRDAYRTLERNLISPVLENAEYDSAARVEALRDILVVLTKNFYVVKLFTQANRREAYRLFMVLNDRGTSLSDAELLRTRSLELLQASRFGQLQEQVAASWDAVFESTNNDVSAFLAAFYASRTGQRAPRRNLYDAYIGNIFPDVDDFVDESSAETFRDLILGLQREHVAFRQISDGEWPFENPTASFWLQRRLERLVSVLGRKGDIPLLLAAWAVSPDDDSEFGKFVNQMERYGFRWFAGSAHSGTLSEAYYEQAVQLRADPEGYGFKDFVAELDTFVAHHVPDSQFRSGLEARLRYGSGPTNRIIKHALTTIEDYWRGLHDDDFARYPALTPGVEAAFDLAQVQIEHVYPQDPQDGNWSDALSSMLHSLGNLTFLSGLDNISVSNKPFEEKRTAYRAAASRMTRSLADEIVWTETVVRKRGTEFVTFLERIYALESLSTSSSSSHRAHWLVAQNGEMSPYGDVFGVQYAYRANLPNGRRVRAGDIMVIMLLGPKGSNRRRDIAAIAEIAVVENEPDGGRIARFSRFLELDPHVDLSAMQSDPRSNRQHSINRVPAAFVEQLFPPGLSIDTLPPVVGPEK